MWKASIPMHTLGNNSINTHKINVVSMNVLATIHTHTKDVSMNTLTTNNHTKD